MLKGRHLLDLIDYTPEEITYLLELSKKLKKMKKEGSEIEYLKKKNIALIFEKDSTRTRCAFEVAAADQGAFTTYIGSIGSQFGKKESIADTAKVLGRMYDGIQYRGFGQKVVEGLADNAGVPVWNGLTDETHPTQVLADFLTVEEHLGSLKGKKIVFFGDCRNNVSIALMIGAVKMGMHFVACGPQKLFPNQALYKKALEIAKETGGRVIFESDTELASTDADIFYTDVWVSMGEPKDVWKERIALLEEYRITDELMALGKKNAIFMHCLPAFHDLETQVGQEIYDEFGVDEMEVADSVFQSKQSVVFDQAENRLHTIKAVMVATIGEIEE